MLKDKTSLENKKADQELMSAKIERTLLRAREAAHKTARFYGTPIYIEKNGNIIAIKP